MRSMEEIYALCVLLTGVVISLGINSKKDLQRLGNDESRKDPK